MGFYVFLKFVYVRCVPNEETVIGGFSLLEHGTDVVSHTTELDEPCDAPLHRDANQERRATEMSAKLVIKPQHIQPA